MELLPWRMSKENAWTKASIMEVLIIHIIICGRDPVRNLSGIMEARVDRNLLPNLWIENFIHQIVENFKESSTFRTAHTNRFLLKATEIAWEDEHEMEHKSR